MAMDGAQILVLVPVNGDFKALAEQTSLSTENSHNLIDASSKDSGHTKWLYGKEDDTVSVESLYTPDDEAYQAIKEAKKNREKIVLRRTENGVDVEEAEALIQTISNDYPDNDNATVSIDFQLNESWREVTPD